MSKNFRSSVLVCLIAVVATAVGLNAQSRQPKRSGATQSAKQATNLVDSDFAVRGTFLLTSWKDLVFIPEDVEVARVMGLPVPLEDDLYESLVVDGDVKITGTVEVGLNAERQMLSIVAIDDDGASIAYEFDLAPINREKAAYLEAYLDYMQTGTFRASADEDGLGTVAQASCSCSASGCSHSQTCAAGQKCKCSCSEPNTCNCWCSGSYY